MAEEAFHFVREDYNLGIRLKFASSRVQGSAMEFPYVVGATPKAKLYRFFTVGLLLIAGSGVLAQSTRVSELVVLERGIFDARTESVVESRSTLGAVHRVRDVRLTQDTVLIPARTSIRFGLRYLVGGSPFGSVVELKLVTKFPGTGLSNPETGVTHQSSEYSVRVPLGSPTYREFQFDKAWEMVEGTWIFEFWHGGRKIGEQVFCVFANGDRSHKQIGDACSAVVG